jgi:hypothetical protein
MAGRGRGRGGASAELAALSPAAAPGAGRARGRQSFPLAGRGRGCGRGLDVDVDVVPGAAASAVAASCVPSFLYTPPPAAYAGPSGMSFASAPARVAASSSANVRPLSQVMNSSGDEFDNTDLCNPARSEAPEES